MERESGAVADPSSARTGPSIVPPGMGRLIRLSEILEAALLLPRCPI